MPTLFSATFPDELKMPASSVQALMESYRERQKTGVVRLAYPSETQLYFLYKRGELANTYLVTPEKYESFTPEQSAEWIRSAKDAYAKSVTISPFALLITKLLIQSRRSSTETFISHRQLAEHLESFKGRHEPALVYLSWRNAAGAVFFGPGYDPHFVFASQDLVLDEIGGFKFLSEWNEPNCAVTVFTTDISVDAWQEYLIRSAFARICEDSLARFQTLAGRALVDSLVRLVDVFAEENNFDISITSRKITDKEMFSSPEKTVYVYRLLLMELFEHFSAVIGPRLYSSTLRDIMKKLPAHQYEIARKFELLPKGYFYE